MAFPAHGLDRVEFHLSRHIDPTGGVVLNPLDLPRDRFIVAPDAWLRCREGGEDPDRYLVTPFVENPPIEVTLREVTVR